MPTRKQTDRFDDSAVNGPHVIVRCTNSQSTFIRQENVLKAGHHVVITWYVHIHRAVHSQWYMRCTIAGSLNVSWTNKNTRLKGKGGGCLSPGDARLLYTESSVFVFLTLNPIHGLWSERLLLVMIEAHISHLERFRAGNSA